MANEEYWPGMSVKQHDNIGKYLLFLGRAMRLCEWRFSLERFPAPNPDVDAQIHCSTNQLHAKIELANDFNDRNLERKREILIHELLHCHLRNVHEAHDTLEIILGKPTYTTYDLQMDSHVETVVHELARMYADQLYDETEAYKWLATKEEIKERKQRKIDEAKEVRRKARAKRRR